MIYYKRKASWKRLLSKLSEVTIPSFCGFLNILKIFFALIATLFILLYASYIFLLPKIFTDEKIENYLNQYLKANSKLLLDIDNLKVSPNYKFDIKLSADKIAFLYPNKKDFVVLYEPDIEVDLLTLFFNYIDLNKIKTKKITINTNFTKNNQYDCFNYIDFNLFNFNNSKFHLRNIKVISNELIFNLYDENIKRNFKLQTKKLTFALSELNKPVIVQTQGEIYGLNKIIDFKLDLSIITQKEFLDSLKTKILKLNYNPLIHASKFKFYTNSDVNLKIKNDSISGYMNLSDFNFVIDNIQIPKNNLSLIFKGKKIRAKGDFNFIKNQFIKLDLNADYSKNKYIELKLNSSEINLADLKKLINAACKIFNFKHNFDSFEIEGTTSADIYLKSNFKTINSSGFANIKNAKVKDNITGLILNNINSNVNFDNNKVAIQNATMLVDNSKFHLEGSIDNKTNLNLKANSDTINVSQILNTLRNLPFVSHIIPELNDFIIQSGFVKVNTNISGTLNNPIIHTNSIVNDFKVFIKSLNCVIQSKEAILSADPVGSVVKEIYITAKDNIINYQNNKITNKQVKLKLSDDNIYIDKTTVIFDKIKAEVQGLVKNYNKDFALDLNLSAFLPLDNNLIIIKNKSPRIIADISVVKNKLIIKNAKIFENSNNLVTIIGSINDFSSKNPDFENLKISLIDRISCIFPKADNLNFEAIGNITVSGTLNNPIITGSAKLYNVICEKYNLYIRDCDLILKNSNLEGNIASLDILDTTLYDVIFKGTLNGDILKILSFSADVFQGKISGKADINIKNLKVDTELILKEISVRHLSSYLKQYSIAASGRLSALLRLSFSGLDLQDALNSLTGYIKFNIDNGELAQFAKLERFLQAGNILSQSILKLTLNSILSSVTKQNTGDFNTIEGTVKINSPMAEIQYINTQGTNMSMHIEGRYNIINNHAILRVLGRIPLNIVNVMGNIGKFSLSQLLDSKISESAIEKMMSVNIQNSETDKIPALTNYHANSQTREFIVLIDGLLNSNSAIKYFKWLYKD